MTTLSLKSLLVASKSTEVEFPGKPDFKIQVSFLSRETLQSLRKKATNKTYKNHQLVETVDDELFLNLYVNSVIKGWSGLKLSYLSELAPISLEDLDPQSELPYSEENALMLMKASTAFDNFISEQVSDLGNFKETK